MNQKTKRKWKVESGKRKLSSNVLVEFLPPANRVTNAHVSSIQVIHHRYKNFT
jgi:hypothetical protein